MLVLLHMELLQGSTECLERLRRQAPAGVSGSKQQQVSHQGLCPYVHYCMGNHTTLNSKERQSRKPATPVLSHKTEGVVGRTASM